MATDLYGRVPELTAGLGRDEAVTRILDAAGGDRAAIEDARDRYVRRLHGQPADYDATAALTLLNRALAEEPPIEPLDWKRRWVRGRKP